MKNAIFAMTLILFAASAQAAKLTLILDNGTQLTLTQDACRDQVTGKLGPCLLAPEAATQDQDACYNPVTGRLEPCLSATR